MTWSASRVYITKLCTPIEGLVYVRLATRPVGRPPLDEETPFIPTDKGGDYEHQSRVLPVLLARERGHDVLVRRGVHLLTTTGHSGLGSRGEARHRDVLDRQRR